MFWFIVQMDGIELHKPLQSQNYYLILILGLLYFISNIKKKKKIFFFSLISFFENNDDIRTIKGFGCLIEKEFLSFGHKVAIRSGFAEDEHKDKERCKCKTNLYQTLFFLFLFIFFLFSTNIFTIFGWSLSNFPSKPNSL